MNRQLQPMVMAFLLMVNCFTLFGQKTERQYFQLTIYHYNSADQLQTLDDYLQHALLPALQKRHVAPIGVFADRGNDTVADKKLYVLVPLQKLEDITSITQELLHDKQYQQAGSNYIDATNEQPPYVRMETILLKAFALSPTLQVPKLNSPSHERVYELRSYESATEKKYANKVHMFNEGDEIGLFKRLNFNAVFYGEVLAGSKMPNLMYMTSFENMTDRDAHWKAFVEDPQWKKLVAMPFYQKNMTRMDISFLQPRPYSQL